MRRPLLAALGCSSLWLIGCWGVSDECVSGGGVECDGGGGRDGGGGDAGTGDGGCTTCPIELSAQVLALSCPGSAGQVADALGNAAFLEIVVTGEGIATPIVLTVPVGQGSTVGPVTIDRGTNVQRRTLALRAHSQSESGPVVAWGTTTVEITQQTANRLTVPVIVRAVDTFVYTNDSAAPQQCTQMNRARAGHTTTVLPDGRALIVGGAQFDALGGRTVHDSAEIYDPNTGLFELMPNGAGGPNLPRVFHTATALPDGRVLIVGGEFDRTPQDRDVLRPTEIFDPSTGVFTVDIIANQGRTRHTATLVDADHVLVVGGYADPDPPPGQSHPTPIASVELFDIVNSRFTVAGSLPEEKAEHCAVAIGNGVVALIGGKHLDVNGTDVVASTNIHFVQCAGGTCAAVMSGGTPLTHLLSTARFGMGCFALDIGTTVQVIMAGGYTTVDDFTAASANASIEVFDPSGLPAVQRLPSTLSAARGNICTVPLVGSTGTTTAGLFIGGFNRDDLPAGATIDRLMLDQGQIITQPAGPGMQQPRSLHQCTLLADGSVLVTGGMSLDGAGNPVSLRTAEIFTPALRQ